MAKPRRAAAGNGGGEKGESNAIEAVDRAARVLLALAARPGPSTLIEVARRADLSKPTTFRILATLVAEGLAAQNPETADYRLGVLPQRFATSVLSAIDFRDEARPVMRRIRDALNETVVLSVREGDARYNIDSAESANAIGQTHRIGIPIPLYAGAASRVLLSGLDDEELLSYLGRTEFVPLSETTMVDRDVLIADIARIRQQGYAISIGEFTPSGHAVASPIADQRGRIIAALHVSIPPGRFSPEAVSRAIAALRDGVETISREIAATQSA